MLEARFVVRDDSYLSKFWKCFENLRKLQMGFHVYEKDVVAYGKIFHVFRVPFLAYAAPKQEIVKIMKDMK